LLHKSVCLLNFIRNKLFHSTLFFCYLQFILWNQQIQMTLEESTCRRIAQELNINQSSQCAHVVVCYQAIYYNGTISIILEYMDGGSLEDLLNKVKTIPEPFLAAICKQVRNKISYLLFYIYWHFWLKTCLVSNMCQCTTLTRHWRM
jgi:serine/threonine protein kinase